jgi:ABC-2 type transport system permease protein
MGLTHDAEEADTRLREREVDVVVLTPGDPFADWDNGEQSAFMLFHNEIDPIEAAYIQIMGQRYAEIVNEQILLTAVENSQSEATEWQDDVSVAKDQASIMRQALSSGDVELAQESAAELKQELDTLTLAVGSGLEMVSQLEEVTGSTENVSQSLREELISVQENTDQILTIADNDAAIADGEAKAAEIESSLEEADRLLIRFREIDSNVLVSPFRSESISITDSELEPMHFYVPGVIALLLQHLAVTMAGLSIVREKLEGAMELFRAGPVSAFEIIVGKYTSYLLIISLLAVILTALIVFGLRVPQLSSWIIYGLVVLGMLLASLGLGFHISLSARSNDEAIQYAMILLLAAIFFSGFFLPLYRLATYVQPLSWALPATYGTILLQDVMLRGQFPSIVQLGALYLFGIVLFLLAWMRLQRQMPKQRMGLVFTEN